MQEDWRFIFLFVLSVSRCLCREEEERFDWRRAHASSWLENVPRRLWEVLLANVKPVLWKDVENVVLLDPLFVTEEQIDLNRDLLVKPLFLKNHQMIRGFYMLHGNACSIYPSTLGGILCMCCKWLYWYSIFTNTAVWNNDSGWDFDWNISMSTDYSPKKSQLSASACSYRQVCCDCLYVKPSAFTNKWI